jgi:hypothetical protein
MAVAVTWINKLHTAEMAEYSRKGGLIHEKEMQRD